MLNKILSFSEIFSGFSLDVSELFVSLLSLKGAPDSAWIESSKDVCLGASRLVAINRTLSAFNLFLKDVVQSASGVECRESLCLLYVVIRPFFIL